VASNPVNFLDLTGLAWFRPDGHPYVVGLEGSAVEPVPGEVGGYMDNNVSAMHSKGPIFFVSIN
jgi:hypothetical protein